MSWAGNPQIHACHISLEMSEHFSNIFDSFLGTTQKNSTILSTEKKKKKKKKKKRKETSGASK